MTSSHPFIFKCPDKRPNLSSTCLQIRNLTKSWTLIFTYLYDDDAFSYGEHGGDGCDGVPNHDGHGDVMNHDGGQSHGHDGGAHGGSHDVSGGDDDHGNDDCDDHGNDGCDDGDKGLTSWLHWG